MQEKEAEEKTRKDRRTIEEKGSKKIKLQIKRTNKLRTYKK